MNTIKLKSLIQETIDSDGFNPDGNPKTGSFPEIADKTQSDLDRMFKRMSPAQKNNPELLHSFLKDYFAGEEIGDAQDWSAKAAAANNGINPKVVSDIVFKIYKASQVK